MLLFVTNLISPVNRAIWGYSAVGAHLTGSQGVEGSNPSISTKTFFMNEKPLFLRAF